MDHNKHEELLNLPRKPMVTIDRSGRLHYLMGADVGDGEMFSPHFINKFCWCEPWADKTPGRAESIHHREIVN